MTACGSAGGDDPTNGDASSSSTTPTTNEPTTNEPTTNEPTTNEPTTNEPTSEPTTSEPTTGEPTTGEPDTETGGEACEEGDDRVAFTVDVGDLPLEQLNGSEEIGYTATVECTVLESTTASAVALDCVGSDEAQHAVGIAIAEGAPAASPFVAGATVTFTYETWSRLYQNCVFGDEEDVSWVRVRDEAGLLLAAVRAESLLPYGQDDLAAAYGPFELALDETCAPMAEGDTGGECMERRLGVAVATADDTGGVVLPHSSAEIAGAHVTVGVAQAVVFDGGKSFECCIEGGTRALELVVARLPD
ncbi:MAG TPA: hypothetical protein VG755_03145 [Nannocystaceae bacterium]|nr:hypothetical protein [Nannocystaceae bacterium]